MGASYAWKGGVEVAGIAVYVKLWPQVQSSSKDGFKMVAPNGAGVSQKLVDSAGNEVSRSDCGKGYDTGNGLVVIDETILGRMDRTGLAELTALCPAETVPFALGEKTYAVRPDKDVPGSDGNLELVWNGLLDSGLVYVTELTLRSGSRDKLLVLHASPDDLLATELPYHAELRQDVPALGLGRDPEKGNLFARFVEAAELDVGPFNHEAIESQWKARRDEAIKAALDGQPVKPVEEQPTAKTAAPDLMAALEASIAAAKAPPKKKAAKSKAKVTA